jgi:hypothetical protein
VARGCHSSHDLHATAGVLWCRRCGSYSTRQPRALASPCPQRPRSEAAKNVLGRLLRGLPPTTAAYLSREAIAGEDGVRQPVHEEAHHQSPPAPPRGPEGEAHHPPLHGHLGGEASSQADRQQAQPSQGESCNILRAVHRGRERAAENPVPFHGYFNLPRRAVHHPASTSPSAEPPHLVNVARHASRFPGAHVGDAKSSRGAATMGAQQATCRPADGESWTRRLAVVGTTVAQPCSLCARPCRGRCASCAHSLCIECARARRPCPARPSVPADADQHADSSGRPVDAGDDEDDAARVLAPEAPGDRPSRPLSHRHRFLGEGLGSEPGTSSHAMPLGPNRRLRGKQRPTSCPAQPYVQPPSASAGLDGPNRVVASAAAISCAAAVAVPADLSVSSASRVLMVLPAVASDHQTAGARRSA